MTYYGLPDQVVFCKNCVMSNQRPSSTPEFKNTVDRQIKTLNIQKDGICDACHAGFQKENINWKQREEELLSLLDTYRSKNGSYDCLVPGSGGKDSAFQAHILKYKYGMHPLTCTWPPILYTKIGKQNFDNWLSVGGFDNVTLKPNPKTHQRLTRMAIRSLFHPFQTFILGQKNLAPKIALQHNIKLIFYGENEAEYGNPIADNASSLRDKSYFTMNNLEDVTLAGRSIRELIDNHGFELSDLLPYLPAGSKELAKSEIEVHYLGYYLKWTPQECFYYAIDNTGFEANPERSEGTYSKYNSLDDKIDGLHYYTTYIKFGLGRATYDAAQEIRNKHITREEAVALVQRFDGEFPHNYFKEVMEFIGMETSEFLDLVDKFRPPHLWEEKNGEWKLKHKVA